MRERMQQVAPHPREGSLIARLLFSFEGATCLFGSEAGINRNRRLLFRKQNPVAIFAGKFTPRPIHIVAQGHQNVALILTAPSRRPSRYRTIPDRQRTIRHHCLLGRIVNAPNPMTMWTSAFGAVRRERLTVEFRLAWRIRARTRIQHPQQIGQRGYASHRRAGSWRAALLLQSNRGWKSVDAVHFRNPHLIEQAPGVRRNRFQIAALSFGIKRPEGERGLARPRHTRENDQRITRYLHIDVLQIVLPRSLYGNEPCKLPVRSHYLSINAGTIASGLMQKSRSFEASDRH